MIVSYRFAFSFSLKFVNKHTHTHAHRILHPSVVPARASLAGETRGCSFRSRKKNERLRLCGCGYHEQCTTCGIAWRSFSGSNFERELHAESNLRIKALFYFVPLAAAEISLLRTR